MRRIYNYKLKNRVKELQHKMTYWECRLWFCFLKNYPIKFYRQRCFGNFIVDFFCRKAMLAIELDGSGHYTSQQMEYDKQRTWELEKLGIKVIRFNNFDVYKNFYAVCTKIDLIVKERIKDISP